MHYFVYFIFQIYEITITFIYHKKIADFHDESVIMAFSAFDFDLCIVYLQLLALMNIFLSFCSGHLFLQFTIDIC